jgi:MerR family glutamine synthetase transcriptional repressor
VRTQGKQRRYTEKDVSRLKKIKYLKDNGFDMRSIKDKLDLLEKSIKDTDLVINTSAPCKMTSLYPVSNRAVLMKLLEKK